MKKNQMILGNLFTVACIAAVLYFQKGQSLGLFFKLIPGTLVGALIGIAFAWWYTKEDKTLDDKEKEKAITFALAFFTLLTTLIVFNGLRAINDYTHIPYALEQRGWGHGSEILLRLTVGLVAGIVFFMAEMALMSKVVPWAALAFDAKLSALSAPSTTPTAAPAAAAAPATGAAAPATTTTDDKGSVHPIVWIIIIAAIAALLSPLFGGGGSTQSNNNGQQQTQQNGQNGVPGASGVQTPDPNAPISTADETVGVVH